MSRPSAGRTLSTDNMRLFWFWTPRRSAFGLAGSTSDRRQDDEQPPAQEMVEQVDRLIAEVARLGREQFRTTSLLEGWGSSLDQLGELMSEHLDHEVHMHDQSARAIDALEDQIRLRVATELLPVVDGLQASISAARGFIRMASSGPGKAALVRRSAGSSLVRRIWILLRATHQQPREPDLVRALDGWQEGLVLVERRLRALLDREGVRPIAALGHTFDPHFHIAVAVGDGHGAGDGTIVAEELSGYTLGDRILRHAEVVVARSNHLAEGVGHDAHRRD